jgi:hypothetical protein
MNSRKSIKWFIFSMVGLLILAGCSTPANAQPAATTVPTEIPTGIVPKDLPAAPNITLADNGKTITLLTGQSFLLQLGEDNVWTVSVDDQSVLKRMINVMVIRGAQGIYVAGKPGTTTLSATGDPICLQNQPPCAAPSIQFKITVIVH